MTKNAFLSKNFKYFQETFIMEEILISEYDRQKKKIIRHLGV